MNDVELDDRGLSIKMIQQRLVYTRDKSFKHRLYTENSWGMIQKMLRNYM